ncbi:MAG: cyclase family protein [Acidimicrobiales bacterium]
MRTSSSPNLTVLPTYEQLPVLEGLDVAHSWGVFGADDELGTLNLLDETTVLAALGAAQTGERICVSLEMSVVDPPLYGRSPLQHSLTQTDRNTWDDRLDTFYPQGSSQWDGFRHVRCREFGFYGGVREDPSEMGARLGIEHWAEQGIVARGILLDIERYFRLRGNHYDPMEQKSISAVTLIEVANSQGVEILPGDALCLRFGWLDRYLELDKQGRIAYANGDALPSYAGLAADALMAQTLWDWHVSAVACDNPALEVSPGDAAIGSLHRRLIPGLGMAIGELFNFEVLAQRCADDDRWTFLILSVPLNFRGGVGSPANAIVVR